MIGLKVSVMNEFYCIALGAIHKFQCFHKRTERTLFTCPLPPPQKRTIKMLIG